MKPYSKLFEAINLLKEGKRLLQELKFSEALKLHEERIHLFSDAPPRLLGACKFHHAIALYKTCNYQQAREIAHEVLHTVMAGGDDVINGARNSLGVLEMIDGNYMAGFKKLAFLSDVGIGQKLREHRGIRPWRGEDIRGKKMAVLTNGLGGIGDCIAFIRMAVMLAKRGALVFLEMPKTLVDIELMGELVKFIDINGMTNEGFEYFCNVVGLPPVMDVTAETLPVDVYLKVSDPYIEKWREMLGPSNKMRIGLCIGGNKSGLNSERFLSAELLKPLLAIDAEFHSLQLEYCESDIGFLNGSSIINHAPYIESMADTAALIHCMDLVISVDTSIAHLAGAMGHPLWVPLPRYKNYYWHEERPWYPQAKLFRQVHEGCWIEPIELVANELLRATQGISN